MFKRLFWLVIGVGFGFGVSFWLMRFVRQTVDRYSPDNVSKELGDALRSLGHDLREAVKEGREAMREREAELRSQLDPMRTLESSAPGNRGQTTPESSLG